MVKEFKRLVREREREREGNNIVKGVAGADSFFNVNFVVVAFVKYP